MADAHEAENGVVGDVFLSRDAIAHASRRARPGDRQRLRGSRSASDRPAQVQRRVPRRPDPRPPHPAHARRHRARAVHGWPGRRRAASQGCRLATRGAPRAARRGRRRHRSDAELPVPNAGAAQPGEPRSGDAARPSASAPRRRASAPIRRLHGARRALRRLRARLRRALARAARPASGQLGRASARCNRRPPRDTAAGRRPGR